MFISRNEIKFWKNQNLNSNINVLNQINNWQKSKKFPKKSQGIRSTTNHTLIQNLKYQNKNGGKKKATKQYSESPEAPRKKLFCDVHHNSQQNHLKQKNQNAFVKRDVSRGTPGRIFFRFFNFW